MICDASIGASHWVDHDDVTADMRVRACSRAHEKGGARPGGLVGGRRPTRLETRPHSWTRPSAEGRRGVTGARSAGYWVTVAGAVIVPDAVVVPSTGASAVSAGVGSDSSVGAVSAETVGEVWLPSSVGGASTVSVGSFRVAGLFEGGQHSRGVNFLETQHRVQCLDGLLRQFLAREAGEGFGGLVQIGLKVRLLTLRALS